jgi:hypothetical protein
VPRVAECVSGGTGAPVESGCGAQAAEWRSATERRSGWEQGRVCTVLANCMEDALLGSRVPVSLPR